MATDAVPGSVTQQESVALPELPDLPLPVGAVTADASSAPLPIAPLAPVEVVPAGVRSLAQVARAAVGLLTHPYPRRAPRAPLTREEHLALAQNEAARLERERQAYRAAALGGPFR